MNQVVLLPAYLTVRSASEAVTVCGNLIAADGDAVVDASRLCFADPFGLALLGATFHMVRQQGRAVRVRGLSAVMGGYLARMDVFEGVILEDCAPRQTQRHNRGDALVELTRLDSQSGVADAAFRLAQALVGHISGIDPEVSPQSCSAG